MRYAFEYARRNGRKKVTLVHKANILKMTNGPVPRRRRARSRSEYPDIQFDDMIVDATAMKLVLAPERFDVIVTMNLFGDILSDLCAGLVGGLGVAPGANIGDATARCSRRCTARAPDIAGKGIANPTALMLSSAMMLDYLRLHEPADRIRAAVRKTLEHGSR